MKELIVYYYEVTRSKRNEDGTPAEGRETVGSGYAFDGDPSPRIDYNRYWDFGSGSVNFVAKDGKAVDCDIDCMLEYISDLGFRGIDVGKLMDNLHDAGDWLETGLGDDRDTRLRISRIPDLPEIDVDRTIKNSDLTVMQEHRILIDGKPMFPEGGTVYGSNPHVTTLVLRPGLRRELEGMWEDMIARRAGVRVAVSLDEDDASADRVARTMRLAAKSRDGLDRALYSIGVADPSGIEPDVVYGDEDGAATWYASVRLTSEID